MTRDHDGISTNEREVAQHWPYCLLPVTDRFYVVYNRFVVPIGYDGTRLFQFADDSDDVLTVSFRAASLGRHLNVPYDEKDFEEIFLYTDTCNPIEQPRFLTEYRRRILQLECLSTCGPMGWTGSMLRPLPL